MTTTIIGLDIAKTVFQRHAEDASGRVLYRKRLKRDGLVKFLRSAPPALIAMEACGSAHYWGRTLRALGHEVRLIPAAYVKPFVKRNKTDARDAEAICEAARRPSMRTVAVKSVAQQCARALETARTGMVQQRTGHMNTVRGLLAEFGVIAAQGVRGFAALCQLIEAADPSIPPALLPCLIPYLTMIRSLTEAIEGLEAQIKARVKADPVMGQLMGIPGVGPLTAHAIVSAIGDGRQFRCARDFAAWVGLTPRQFSSGQKTRSGKIIRQGDRGLRCLLVLGASAMLRQAKAKPPKATPPRATPPRATPPQASAWLRGLMARRPVRVAVVAQAAKTARIAWAILTSGESYRAPRDQAGGQAEGQVGGQVPLAAAA